MDTNRTDAPDGRIAVVLSGAAARGAFQAGALAALMPVLERTDQPPPILLGTSAGAINAAFWGAHAHLPADAAAKSLLALWSEMSHADVFEPLAVEFGPWALEYLAGAAFGAGDGTESLLDTEPLRRTADDRLDVERLHANVTAGHVAKVGVVATRVPPGEKRRETGMASGRSVLFLDEGHPTDYAGDDRRAQDVVRGPITRAHVLASAAIPVAFPAQQVTEPAEAAGWYVDGGVRLNAPLRHAIRLGASRIILISAASTTHGDSYGPSPDDPEPDMAYAGAQVLHAVLADRMIEDIHAIHRMNSLVAQVENPAYGAPGKLTRYRSPDDHYRRIELTTISPEPGRMGELATRIHRQRTDRLGRIRELDNWLLGRVLRGAGNEKGYRELLSYLFFDEQYFTESIALGKEAAEAALTPGPVS